MEHATPILDLISLIGILRGLKIALLSFFCGTYALGAINCATWISMQPDKFHLTELVQELSTQYPRLQLTLIKESESWTVVSEAGTEVSEPECGLYCVGSITKMFVATSIMKRVESGKLALDDKIDKYLPSVPSGNEVTLRNLLEHRSGYTDYLTRTSFGLRWILGRDRVWEADDILKYAKLEKLKFAADSQFDYSNTNYVLLAMVLEKIEGKDYRTILNSEILEARGLKSSLFVTQQPPAALLRPYDAKFLPRPTRFLLSKTSSLTTGAHAAGSLVSNTQDVATFLNDLIHGRVIPQADVDQMTHFKEASYESIPSFDGYGLGISRFTIDGEPMWGHAGAIPGYSAIVAYDPKNDFVVAAASNYSYIDFELILKKAREHVAASPD